MGLGPYWHQQNMLYNKSSVLNLLNYALPKIYPEILMEGLENAKMKYIINRQMRKIGSFI